MINEQIGLLETEMAVVAEVIKSRNQEGFNEYGPLLEAFTKHAMGLTHGEEFHNLNRIKTNHAAIDLVNASGTIVVQVTANADAKKIRHTIEKFEEIDSATGKSIKDGFPNLKNLYVFGFCKASKSSSLLPPVPAYCKSITRDYFYPLLTQNLDVDAVQQLRNKLRSMSYFDQVRTLTDDASIEIMRQNIDRNAIRHPISCEDSHSRMTQSLKDLTTFINTGKGPDGKQVCKPRWDFGNQKYRAYLDSVFSEVSKILEICNKAKNEQGRDFLNLSQKDMEAIDSSKRKVESLTSQLFNQRA